MLKATFAFDTQLEDGTLIPNGMTEEQYYQWINVTPNKSLDIQFTRQYLIDLLEFQGVECEFLTVQEAVRSRTQFYYLMECFSETLKWMGFKTKEGKEPFSYISDKALACARKKRCKIILHCGAEGTEGDCIKEITVLLSLYCRKYDIPETQVHYVTSNMKFLEKYMLERGGLRYKSFINAWQIPYFWEVSQLVNEIKKDDEDMFVNPDSFKRNLNNKKLRFLCLNRVPRAHRYLLTSYLWHKHKDKGLISMPKWDYNSYEHWGPWKSLTREMDMFTNIIKRFEASLPLTVDHKYKIGSKQDDMTWNITSDPYLRTNLSIINETSFTNKNVFHTEKTFKAIMNMHPFIICGDYGILQSLRDMGFKTFSPHIDETYDTIVNNRHRIQALMKEIDRLCNMKGPDFNRLMRNLDDIVLYNYEHFWKPCNFTYKLFERLFW